MMDKGNRNSVVFFLLLLLLLLKRLKFCFVNFLVVFPVTFPLTVFVAATEAELHF